MLEEPTIFRDNDRIRVEGAGASGADLETTIVSGGGTINLVLADAAQTLVNAPGNRCWMLAPKGAVTVSETATTSTGSPNVTLTDAGNWHRGDPITIVGAGAAGDLTSFIISGQGTVNIVLADNAGSPVSGAVVKEPAKTLGQVRFQDLSQMRNLDISDSEWSGLHRATPSPDGLTIIPENAEHFATLLDGSRLGTRVTNTIQTNNVSTAADTTEFRTGIDSLQITGTGGGTNHANFNFSTAGLKGSWIMGTMEAKREQVGADLQAQSQIRFSTATTQALALQSATLCMTEETVLGGAGNQGDWLTYQAIAYVAAEHDVRLQMFLDTNGAASSDDIIYIDRVDLWVIDPLSLFDLPKVIDRLTGAKTYDPPNLTNGSSDDTTVTVTGARQGDYVMVSFDQINANGWELVGQVTANDTVSTRLTNNTGGAVNLGSGTLRATILRI